MIKKMILSTSSPFGGIRGGLQIAPGGIKEGLWSLSLSPSPIPCLSTDRYIAERKCYDKVLAFRQRTAYL